jgi:hypothetical protein
MQDRTQASSACSGTWLCTNSVHRSGSSPAPSSWAAATLVLRQQGGILRHGDRVQVDHAVEGVVGVLQRHPLAQRAEVVAEVEGVGGGLDAGQDAKPW